MSFNYCGFRCAFGFGENWARRAQHQLSHPEWDSCCLEAAGQRGQRGGTGEIHPQELLAKHRDGTASSGHLQNLELEVFGIHCSPKEMLWSIKKQLLTAGDHYTEHSVGHATAAILPEDGNVFGTAFGAFVPLMLSPSLLLPFAFQIAARKTCKWKRRGPPWAQITLRAGVQIFLWINFTAADLGPEGSLRCWELCTCISKRHSLPHLSHSASKQDGSEGKLKSLVLHKRSRKSGIFPQFIQGTGGSLRNHETSAWGSGDREASLPILPVPPFPSPCSLFPIFPAPWHLLCRGTPVPFSFKDPDFGNLVFHSLPFLFWS